MRVVNIHADGRLVYTGLIDRAAERCGLSVKALIACINKKANVRQPRLFYTDAEGQTRLQPKATEYLASFAGV